MLFCRKVAIVTGASSGIGAAAAVLFAKEGARVALVARNETKLNSVAQRCAELGLPPLIIKADLSNEQQASTIVKKTINHFGKLDVLVNNAGILSNCFITDSNILQAFDEVMNTNLRAIVQLTSLATPHLVETKGNIVNVSSIGSQKVTGGNYLLYCVSKAGLDHFTRCAALDLAAFGVRVNSVNPGPVRTDAVKDSGIENEFWEEQRIRTALGRLGEPEEIAEVIAFLASDKARSVTGSAYVSDNGYLIN